MDKQHQDIKGVATVPEVDRSVQRIPVKVDLRRLPVDQRAGILRPVLDAPIKGIPADDVAITAPARREAWFWEGMSRHGNNILLAMGYARVSHKWLTEQCEDPNFKRRLLLAQIQRFSRPVEVAESVMEGKVGESVEVQTVLLHAARTVMELLRDYYGVLHEVMPGLVPRVTKPKSSKGVQRFRVLMGTEHTGIELEVSDETRSD